MKISMFLKSMGSRIVVVAVFFVVFLQVGISKTFAESMTRTVQESLIEKGFDPGPVDGILGPKTKAAIMKFQESNGLTANGEVDDATKSSLLVTMSAVPSPASAVSVPTTPAFSEDDTGPDAGDGNIAWGHHMSATTTSASAALIPTTPAFSEDDTGLDAPDGDIAWGRHKS